MKPPLWVLVWLQRTTTRSSSATARALPIYEALGDRHFTARTLIQLGYAALTQARPETASGPIHRAMSIAAQLGDAWDIAESLQAVANLCSLTAPDTAAMLGGAADHLREQISTLAHPADAVVNRDHLTRARERIGPDRFQAAWAEGRATPLDAVVTVALAAARSDDGRGAGPSGSGSRLEKMPSNALRGPGHLPRLRPAARDVSGQRRRLLLLWD